MKISKELQAKYEKLQSDLREMGAVAIAFSGGVDSTLLLKVAHDVLGDDCIAITAEPHSFPKREREEAESFCEQEGIRQYRLEINELEVEGFTQNPPNRCYLCKKAIFSGIKQMAAEYGITYVLDGSNMDDTGDYRPGMQAIAELEIKSPLKECGLHKAEIRELSAALHLPTWEKPAYACLSTRFAYGEEITDEKLRMVDLGEQKLLDLGFRQMRVRIHGDSLARIEVPEGDLIRLFEQRNEIVQAFRSYGFVHVSMDLAGYRMGSMNEVLSGK